MKREYFSHTSKDGNRKQGAASDGQCIALVDARFLVWLAQHTQSGPKQDAVNRNGMAQFLGDALSHAGLDVDVKRIYWYSEENESLDVDGQIVRKVLSHDLDGGVSLLKTLGQDLRQLAVNKACDHLLLATDDERFLTVIDDAQLTGLCVHILADEAARNMPKLHQTDPGWGRLLSQADQRILVQPKALLEILQGTSGQVDRQLLLRMRHRLTRALSLSEKKMLREIFRAVALGTHDPDGPQNVNPLSSSPVIEEPI